MKRLLAILPFMIATAFAQVAGSITGTVLDQSGASIPGVKVTATNISTDVSQSTVTSAAGSYTIPALPPGTYRVTCEASGFAKLVRQPIVVETNARVTLDLTMTVSSTVTEVTVTAEAPMVQQSNAVVQYNVTQKQLEDLPIADQSVLNVLNLMPGVIGEVGSEAAAITTGYTMPGSAISVSGARMGTTQYKADGISNNSMFFGRISLAFSTDAVQEVSVQQNGYSAEFGRTGGGVVQMSTRSGANELHGTLFSFHQNDALNAMPYANSFRTKGKLRYWRGGIDVGGPIYVPKLYDGRNRTFFFFGYEPRRQNSDMLAFTRVPTELERKGDFSESFYNKNLPYPVTIFRQFEFNESGTALTNRRIILPANAPYPQWEGNKIPERFISPIAKKLLEQIPLPNYPTQWDGVNRVDLRGVTNTDNRMLAKIDQVLSAANRMSFRIAFVPTRGERFFQGGKDSLINATPTDVSRGTNVVLSDTHVFGPNKINEFRAGFNRSNIRREANEAQLSKNWYKEFGIPSRLDRGMVRLGLNDFQPYATDVGNYEIDNIYEINNSFTWILGRHSLRIGGEFQALQQNLTNLSAVQGFWDFSSSITSIGNVNTSAYPGIGVAGARTGFSIASLLLGFPSSITMAADVVPYQYRWKYIAGYLQDDFKATPRLTLNLGVRYQIEVPRSEKHHNQGYFVNERAVNSAGREVFGYLQLNGLGGAINTLFPTRYNNIEPRLGLAYRLPGNGIGPWKVIRAGYAISHTPTNGLFNSPLPNLNPRPSQLVSTGGKDGGWVQLDWNPLVLPKGLPPWPTDGKFADLQNIETPVAVSHDVTIPYLQQWNFGLGFEFSPTLGLELNYVGSKGTNLFGPSVRTNTINLPEYIRQFNSGLNMGDLFPNPAGIVDQNGNVIMVSRANLLRPNPLLGSITDILSQGHNSIYNSLQVQFQKRYSHGLSLTANYTWSKSIDTVSCEGQFCTSGLGTYAPTLPQLYSGDRRLERSISTFDTPHVFRLFASYELPFGRGRRLLANAPGWVNHAIGGWKISAVASAQSNLPIIAQLGNNAGWPDDVGNIRPNWKSGVDPVNPDWKAHLNDPVQRYAQYINVLKVMEPPARFTLGNAPRTIPHVRAPRTGSFDLNIMKNFRINERVTASLRGELYNALNHPFITASQANKTSVYSNLYYSSNEPPTVTRGNLNTSFTDYSTHVRTRACQLGVKLYF